MKNFKNCLLKLIFLTWFKKKCLRPETTRTTKCYSEDVPWICLSIGLLFGQAVVHFLAWIAKQPDPSKGTHMVLYNILSKTPSHSNSIYSHEDRGRLVLILLFFVWLVLARFPKVVKPVRDIEEKWTFAMKHTGCFFLFFKFQFISLLLW